MACLKSCLSTSQSSSEDDHYANKRHYLHYGVDDTPRVHVTILLGFQISLAHILAASSTAAIISSMICADENFSASLFSTTSVMSGLATIIQTTLGVRLPIFQGPAFLYLYPYLRARENPNWQCNSETGSPSNNSYSDHDNVSITDTISEPWMMEWRQVQGSLMVASLLHVIIGMFGLSGLILRVLGPLTMTTVIMLLGFPLQFIIWDMAEIHWGVAAMSIVVIVIISQYLSHVHVPFPIWRSGKGLALFRYPVFEVFPLLLSMLIAWFVCYILTIAGAFTDDINDAGYKVRTDSSLGAISKSSVFNIPYPGQYGAPGIKFEYVILFFIAGLGSILESICDYMQASAVCGVEKPQSHAVNRGVLLEGVCTMLSGAMGAGHATTSYSANNGLISITKVASRWVVVVSGVFMIIFGILGKLGALIVSIPLPALTGVQLLGIGLMIGTAFSNLQSVDLSKPRNMAVLGLSLFSGMAIPGWVNKNEASITTGNTSLDLLIKAMVGTPIVFGGLVSCFLDATIPDADKTSGTVSEIRVEETNLTHICPEDSSVSLNHNVTTTGQLKHRQDNGQFNQHGQNGISGLDIDLSDRPMVCATYNESIASTEAQQRPQEDHPHRRTNTVYDPPWFADTIRGWNRKGYIKFLPRACKSDSS